MNLIIQLTFTVVGALCFYAVFKASFRKGRVSKLPIARRTYALIAAWLLFGAALMAQERRTDFSSAADYHRLQQSRRIAAALSVLVIASYGWDMRRLRES